MSPVPYSVGLVLVAIFVLCTCWLRRALKITLPAIQNMKAVLPYPFWGRDPKILQEQARIVLETSAELFKNSPLGLEFPKLFESIQCSRFFEGVP